MFAAASGPLHSQPRQRLLLEMQPTLPLQSKKAGLLDTDLRGQGAGRVDVADGNVALLPQRVVGESVAAEILADVAVGPVGDRVQLPAFVLALQELDVGAGAA